MSNEEAFELSTTTGEWFQKSLIHVNSQRVIKIKTLNTELKLVLKGNARYLRQGNIGMSKTASSRPIISKFIFFWTGKPTKMCIPCRIGFGAALHRDRNGQTKTLPIVVKACSGCRAENRRNYTTQMKPLSA